MAKNLTPQNKDIKHKNENKKKTHNPDYAINKSRQPNQPKDYSQGTEAQGTERP